MSPVIHLYLQPDCQPCRLTKRKLDQMSIDYIEVDLSVEGEALEYVVNDLGYQSAPVVVVDDDNHWSGYRPDLLEMLTPF